MIKSLQSFLLVALCISCVAVSAQKLPQADSVQNSYLNKRAKTFFFELFGPGSVYSLNYDTRFQKKQDGLGGRAGITFYADSESSFFTVPVVINYLLGKKGKYFEVGAGITFYTFKSDSYDTFFNDGDRNSYEFDGLGYNIKAKRDNGILGTLNFGYRYQPIDGGFSFRGGVSPIFSTSKMIPYWPYISFGYAF